jgi:hypothetical protein
MVSRHELEETSQLRLLFVLPCLLLGSVTGSTLSGNLVRSQVEPGFRVEVNGFAYDWKEIGRFVVPGETLRLSVLGPNTHSGWVASGGELTEAAGVTCWVAPMEPGQYPLLCSNGAAVRRINAFVMVPYAELDSRGYLRGAHIGRYPATSPSFPNFTKPRGFIEVTPDNIDVRVSDRYTVRDFMPRNGDGWPKYIVLREELLVKLEMFTDMVNDAGYACDRLTIFSGYRSPFYNRRNRSGRNSAHVYGGAADLFVDGNGDGHMDDLNGDGSVDRRDAQVLVGLVDRLEALHPEVVGGCGWYRRRATRGPFIHVDVRGVRSRWHQ